MLSDEEVPGDAAGDPAHGSAGRGGERPDRVTYNFYGTVYAGGGRFGDSFDDGLSDWRVRRPTGMLRDAEVAATVSNYVPPSTFQEAVACLRQDHLVVLAGAPGSGRRAGALALLREVTDGMLVVLSPAMTPQELAGRAYQGRYGYLVIDSDGVGGPGTDPAWAEVAARVRAAGSYLVVATTSAASQHRPPAVPYLAWEPPPAAEVLRGHLAGSWAKDDVDILVEFLAGRLPARCALRWLASLARLVNAGRNPAQALADLAELDGRQVDQWFSQPRTSRELAEVTVAAFLPCATERAFRSRLAQLERYLRRPRPPTGQWRPSWTVSDGLLRARRAGYRASATRVVSFKKSSYRRFALARIWDTGPAWFLAAVRKWIDAAVAGADQLELTSGLALLATTNFDDVESTFLEPWSRSRLGQPGQVSAAYLLWYMCQDEATAPLALRTCLRWSRSADAHQRATAVLAFSGELGACYPADAARRLWQLAIRSDDVRAASCTALGRLFALLVDRTHQAGAILTMLDAHRYRSGVLAGRPRRGGATVDAARAVLTACSYRTGRPAVAELLRTEPERLEVVTRLLAGVLRSRTARTDGVAALWDVLQAFPHTSSDPVTEAHAFGQSLASALTSTERTQLRLDLTRLDRRQPGRVAGGLPADTLAACLAAVAVRGSAGPSGISGWPPETRRR